MQNGLEIHSAPRHCVVLADLNENARLHRGPTSDHVISATYRPSMSDFSVLYQVLSRYRCQRPDVTVTLKGRTVSNGTRGPFGNEYPISGDARSQGGRDMRRLILVVTACATVAVPTSIAVVSMAPQAGATVSLTCAKLKGTTNGPVSASKCTVSKAQRKLYKTLTAPSAISLATGGTLTWASSGETVTIGPSTLSSGSGGCKPKDTEEIATGTVTGGTSKVTNAGDTFYADVCIDSKGHIKNAKGTVISL